MRRLVLGLVVALMGCLATPRTAETHPRQGLRVVVDNENWHDVTVYAVHGGIASRLCQVVSFQRAGCTVPPALAPEGEGVQLAARTFAEGQVFVTDEISAHAGDVILLTLENQLPMSHYSVRYR